MSFSDVSVGSIAVNFGTDVGTGDSKSDIFKMYKIHMLF